MGGAKNCPETPRQKMIGMMYLVLTAMLALNVSTEVLNGFRLVDDSLHSSIKATDNRNNEMLEDFRFINEQNEAKNGEWYRKALDLQKRSDSLYNYLQNFKYQLAILADGADKADPEARQIKANSNFDVTGQYALVEGHGEELRNMITDYKNYLIDLTDGRKRAEFEQLFATNRGVNHDGDSISWEEVVFESMPVGASVTILTKLQSDVRTAEGEMIAYLQDQTDATDFRVNRMQAFVIPNSRYVIRGGKYSAKIILAGVDSTQTPNYYVEGTQLGADGLYEVTATGSGLKKYKGELVLPAADGSELRLPFESDYSVGEPSVTISNTDLTIMYRDYSNKFSISVPGVSNDKVRVSVNGASAQQSGGYWIIRPGSGNKVTISVSAEVDGRMQAMGSQDYTVKDLPKPSSYFKSGATEIQEGKITRAALLNPNATVIASYGPDGLLPLKFTVTSFQLQTSFGLTQSNSNKFTQQQIDQLSKLKQGAMVNIVDIRAKGEGGKELRLRGMALTLN